MPAPLAVRRPAPPAPGDPTLLAAPPAPHWSAPVRHWPITVALALAAGAAAGLGARSFGQNVYLVEGNLIHTPLPVGESLRGEYTPPTPQTLLALLRGQRQLEEVARDLDLPVSPKTLDRCLRVTRPQNADAVTVTLEWPDPAQGCAVVDRLIANHAKLVAQVRRDKIADGMGLVRGELAAAEARLADARRDYAALPPGTNPARLRAEWDRLSSALSALNVELGTARDELAQCESRIARLDARSQALAAGKPADEDEAPPAQRARRGDLLAAIAEAENRAAEVEPQIATKSREVAALKPLLDRRAIGRVEYERVLGEVAALEARRKTASDDLERRKRDLAELPLREAKAERKEREIARESLSSKLAAVQRDADAKRHEQALLGEHIAAEAVAARKLERAEEAHRAVGQRLAALTRLAEDGGSEFTATHPARASAQPSGSNKKSLAALLFVGLFGAGLSGLVGRAYLAEKRRPAGSGTCGLAVLAAAEPPRPGAAPSPGGGARQIALRLREPVNNSGGVVTFTPADADTPVDDVVNHLARYLSLLNQNVLVLDARPPVDDDVLSAPLPPQNERLFGHYTNYDIALPDVAAEVPLTAVTAGEVALPPEGGDGTEFIVPTAFQGVHRLPAGRLLEDPDLLASAAMRELMEKLAEKYDKVLVVAPPAADAAAAEVLGGYADGAVVLFPGAARQRPEVCRAVAAMRRAGVPWVGAVVRG